MVTRRDPKQGVVDLLFQIVENRRNVVQEIIVEGNRNTSEELIRSQLEIRPGDVLDLRKVGSSRQSLYKTGAYSTVEITREELDSPGADRVLRLRVNPATDETDPFNVDRVGFSLQQEAGLRRHYLLNYSYRFERSRTYDTGPEAFFDVPLRLAFLTADACRSAATECSSSTMSCGSPW
jgi:outer membrane protein assembly factor BamA